LQPLTAAFEGRRFFVGFVLPVAARAYVEVLYTASRGFLQTPRATRLCHDAQHFLWSFSDGFVTVVTVLVYQSPV
jgi:hypothetical protein